MVIAWFYLPNKHLFPALRGMHGVGLHDPNILFPTGVRWTEGDSRETSGLNVDIRMLREGVMGPFTVCPQPSLVATTAW